jgi:hypothetical protein
MAEHFAKQSDFVPPTTATERQLAEIWSALLGVSPLGVNDDFFAVGGHSLLAAQLAARAGLAFGFELPLRTVFECATIARLAEYVDATLVASAVGGRPRAVSAAALKEDRL